MLLQSTLDPPTLTVLLSGASLLIGLWTRASVAELKADVKEHVQDHYVSKELCAQKHAREAE